MTTQRYTHDDPAYGEYLPGEDDIACTYESAEAAEDAILRYALSRWPNRHRRRAAHAPKV